MDLNCEPTSEFPCWLSSFDSSIPPLLHLRGFIHLQVQEGPIEAMVVVVRVIMRWSYPNIWDTGEVLSWQFPCCLGLGLGSWLSRDPSWPNFPRCSISAGSVKPQDFSVFRHDICQMFYISRFSNILKSIREKGRNSRHFKLYIYVEFRHLY